MSAQVDSLEDDFAYGTNVKQASVGVRMGFIRKVYMILTAQLLATTVVCAAFIMIKPLKEFSQNNQFMLMLCFVASLGVLIALHVKKHEHPINMYLLAAFTLIESYTIGTVVTFYKVEIVLQAFILTLSVFMCLTSYTMQSKHDFSAWGAGLFSGLMVLIGAGIIGMFFHSDKFELMCASAGALLFCLFIIFDTHMIMRRVSPEDYLIASISLYLDVINLFLETLRILSKLQRK
uniref:Protein lifeguard 4-like n=1 Tax=Ciona intestinalis TaxID=7719 RepID=F6W3K8_CIOIN|nr:protein lifeguard 4-like [Ciona intestinalis]|eukprot:XP_002130837.1 protein lifeguard 4-like [Ciona intestinalis]